MRAAFSQTLAIKLLNKLSTLLNAYSWYPACQLVLPVTIRAWVITLHLLAYYLHSPNTFLTVEIKACGLCTKITVDRFTVTKKASEPEGGYCYTVATFAVSKPTRASRAQWGGYKSQWPKHLQSQKRLLYLCSVVALENNLWLWISQKPGSAWLGEEGSHRSHCCEHITPFKQWEIHLINGLKPEI